MSQILDEKRRELWAKMGEPDRPEHPPARYLVSKPGFLLQSEYQALSKEQKKLPPRDQQQCLKAMWRRRKPKHRRSWEASRAVSRGPDEDDAGAAESTTLKHRRSDLAERCEVPAASAGGRTRPEAKLTEGHLTDLLRARMYPCPYFVYPGPRSGIPLFPFPFVPSAVEGPLTPRQYSPPNSASPKYGGLCCVS